MAWLRLPDGVSSIGRAVLALWLIALVGFGAIDRSVGSSYANNFSLPATDSSRALDVLKANFPAQAGDSEQIVIQAKDGTLHDPATRAEVEAMLAKVTQLPHVRAVTTPYELGGQISRDGTIGLATVHLDALAQNVPKGAVTALIDTAKSVDSAVLNVQLGGPAIENSEQNRQSSSEGLGIIFALIVLFFAFRRSFLCALLPLVSALMAIGVGTSIIGLLTHVVRGPAVRTDPGHPDRASGSASTTPCSSSAGTAADSSAGRTPEEAAVTALNTSGRAVFFAGIIICIALLGMFALQVSFLYGVALSAALVVVLTMLASLTLLPAMLGFYGMKSLRRGERRRLESAGAPRGARTGLLVALGPAAREPGAHPERRRPGGHRGAGAAVLQHAPRAHRRRQRRHLLDHPAGL